MAIGDVEDGNTLCGQTMEETASMKKVYYSGYKHSPLPFFCFNDIGCEFRH